MDEFFQILKETNSVEIAMDNLKKVLIKRKLEITDEVADGVTDGVTSGIAGGAATGASTNADEGVGNESYEEVKREYLELLKLMRKDKILSEIVKGK